jgi:hypothetical protein
MIKAAPLEPQAQRSVRDYRRARDVAYRIMGYLTDAQ